MIAGTKERLAQVKGRSPLAPVFAANILQGRKVLITGGGSGLGQAIAIGLAGYGAHLVICGRRADKLDETASIIRQSGGLCDTIPCDIRQPDQIEAMFDQIWASGPLNILINNAAGNFLARTETLSARAIEAVIRPSLLGALWCTVAAGRRWIAAGQSGTVLTILASGLGNGRPFTVPLTISKAALLEMTRSLAIEWGPKGIRMVAIAPGLFPTAATRTIGLAADAGVAAPSRIPVGREGRMDELVNLATFLVSDASPYVNGEVVSIDGGSGLTGADAGRMFAWTDEDWQALRGG
jgi:NAD(P)-dependent dehydrogenase (short-subunit alcohol dehydrogenase family)